MYNEIDILGNEIQKGDVVLSLSRGYGYIPIYIAVAGKSGEYTNIGYVNENNGVVSRYHNSAIASMRDSAPIKANVYFRNNPKKLQQVKEIVEEFIKNTL
jgi:hypothetical protein